MRVRAGLAAAGLAVLVAGCTTVPPPAPGALAVEAARYICADGTAFPALFDRAGEGATLTFERTDRDDRDAMAQDSGFRIVMVTQRPASGLWYAGSGWSLRGKGEEATLTRPDGRTSQCRAGGSDAVPMTNPAAI